MTQTVPFQLGIALDAGKDARRPEDWAALIERIDGKADFVTLEDRFASADGDGADAVLLANWLGGRTRHVGIFAGAPLNVLEPFHVSTGIATLDYVSEGRAGLLVQIKAGEEAETAARAIGSLDGFPGTHPAARLEDGLESIEVIRALWDSWEDDAVIRDSKTQRFIDGEKLHYIKFEGKRFSVLGPSITPRPPQGQPVIATSFGPGDEVALARAADLVFLHAGAEIALAASLRQADGAWPLVIADLSFGTGEEAGELPRLLAEWRAAGISGVRFRPTDLASGLDALLDTAFPAIRAAGLAGPDHTGSLRQRFGLDPVRNRYAAAS